MTQKYVDLSAAASDDRMNGCGNALIHLSDGTAIWIDYDGTSYYLKYSSDHVSVGGTIATLAAPFLLTSSAVLTVCRNTSDDLFVLGASTTAANIVCKAFTKGAGYTWTAQTALDEASFGVGSYVSLAALWCNTGGGTSSKGHIFAIGVTSLNVTKYAIGDAGAALAGSGTFVVSANPNPAFLPNGPTTSYPWVDLSPDGVGATSGLGVSGGANTSTVAVGTWGINSSGSLSTSTSLAGISSGTLSVTTKLRVIRYGSNGWAVVYPSSSNATRYMISRFSASAQLTTGVDSGTPASMPLNSANLGWDAFLDSTNTKIWLFALANQVSGNQQMYREGCAVGSGVVWDGSATTDDQLTNCFATQDDVRAVKEPTAAVVDWQAFVQTAASNYALDGDNTSLYSAPSAPTLVSPATGANQDISGGVTFTATYNSTDGFNQNAYALRQKIGAGSYSYWRSSDTTWQATIQWNTINTAPAANFSISPTGLSNGNAYNWSYASQEVGNSLQGPFATDFALTTAAGPTVVVNAPTGAQPGVRPLVTWTPTVVGAEINWRVIIYTAAQYGAGGFAAGVGAFAYDSGLVTSAATSVTPNVDLVNATTYRAYIQIAQTGGQTSVWAFSGFSVAFDSPAQPLLTGSYDSANARSLLNVQARDNLLSLNQGSLETNTTGWAAGANTTIAQSATFALDGSFSLSLTATAGADMSATTPTGVSGTAILASTQYTFMAWLRAGSALRSCTVTCFWYQTGGAASAVRASDAVTLNDAVGSWTQLTSTVTSPSDAAWAAIVVKVTAAGASEIHYADEIAIAVGASTTWTRGGIVGTSTVLLQYTDNSGVTWATVRGAGAVSVPSPSETAAVVYDYEIPNNATRGYRATVNAP